MPSESYEIRACTRRDIDGIFEINKQSNIFATAQFITSPMSIERTMKGKRYLILVVEDLQTGQTVGYTTIKKRTRGVIFSELVGVNKSHHKKGLGKSILIATLNLANIEKVGSLENKWHGWKVYSEVPGNNVASQAMYLSAGFKREGILRIHTAARNDLHIFGFYLEEVDIPEYTTKVEIVTDSLKDYLGRKLLGQQAEREEDGGLKKWLQ